MNDSILYLINKIGVWNLFTIVALIFSTLLAYYFYFKSFYRIVYAKNRICKNCLKIKDWHDAQTQFISRVVFLNNGRKTITKSELQKIQILGNNIDNVRIIEPKSDLRLKISNNKKILTIYFEHLDSNNYFVVELHHTKDITIKGRISETGKFLDTETPTWLFINGIFLAYCFISLLIPFFITFIDKNPVNLISNFIINLIILVVSLKLIRFIHKKFFISDKIIDEFLECTNKHSNEFKKTY